MSQVSSRKATLHERFSLARRNAGFPPMITIAASYPSAAAAPTDAFLQKRVLELQEHFPLLNARMEGYRTTAPFQVLREKPWAPEDILSESTYVANEDSTVELERVIAREGEDAIHEDIDALPLWQVRRLTSPPKDTVYIALTADHCVTDGRGILVLFDALLSPDISSLPFEKLEAITRFEDTVPTKPSLAHALPIVFQHFILPYLPSFIQPYLAPYIAWPHTLIRGPPTSFPPLSSLVSLSAPLISALKTTAKSHGVSTLHPVLKTAYSLAIYSRFRYTLPPPFIVRASSPRSERDPALGHAYCTANYVSSHRLDIQFGPAEDFWSYADKVAKDLRNPGAIARGRMGMGMLAHIPDGVVDPPHPTDAAHRPTGWESFFLDEADSDKPYGETLSFSNLGYARLPAGAKDMAWGQLPSPFAAAVATNVMGHEGGVKVMTVCMDGAAVGKDDVKELEKVFVQVLERLVEGKTRMEELLAKQ
ncbi:hypothetical protein IAT38_007148 [Cryptococcus sp. DSM 104549]